MQKTDFLNIGLCPRLQPRWDTGWLCQLHSVRFQYLRPGQQDNRISESERDLLRNLPLHRALSPPWCGGCLWLQPSLLAYQLLQTPVCCPLPDPGQPGPATGQRPGAGCAWESRGQDGVTFSFSEKRFFFWQKFSDGKSSSRSKWFVRDRKLRMPWWRMWRELLVMEVIITQ